MKGISVCGLSDFGDCSKTAIGQDQRHDVVGCVPFETAAHSEVLA